MKSAVLIDIKGRQLGKLTRQVNLGCSKIISIPVKKFFKLGIMILFSLFFVLGSVSAPTFSGVKAAQNDEQRKALEDQLSQLENQINQYEATIEQYQKQGTSLQGEIKKLEAQIAKLNLQIKAINLTLTKLDAEITSTQAQIQQTQSDIDLNKKNLAQILQSVYENDRNGLIEILLKNPQLSDFFGDLNNLLAVQDNLRTVIDQIAESRQQLIDQKEVLANERSDTAALKDYQNAQKASIQQTQAEKTNLLTVTKGKESVYQQLLTETKKSAAEIRKQIFNLLGGGELAFGDAYQLAKMAENATGIRAALLLAVLDRESALGKNVGQCNYQTAMHPTRDIPVFLAIINNLGLKDSLDNGVIKVSCANSDGAYGGAMGPAQFIPSTWALYAGYSKNSSGKWNYDKGGDDVEDITGNKPSSPWNNSDAFVATSLFLKDAYNSSACTSYADQYSNILPKQVLQERCAAAKYYAGSRWFTYRFTYGDKVISLADQFQDDIDILNS